MPVSYHLGRFPPTTIDFVRLVRQLGEANRAVARYDGLLTAIPNPDILLSPLRVQEAVLSSKIEGTNVTMSEVLEAAAGGDHEISEPKRDDIEEVLNYRAALTVAAEELSGRPLSQHLLRQAHHHLMQGVRGQDKFPGSYRTEQNWIGPKGCDLSGASFIPIAPEHLAAGMDDWTAYVLDESQPDPLTQLAVAHVEFEALHPFRDGNGRLGRMLIPLFLFQRRLLTTPNFYMSAFFEANREEYVERLRRVSEAEEWTEWIAFFLRGVAIQASDNERKARAILALYDRSKEDIASATHSQHAIRILDFIFQYPIFSGPQFAERSGVPRPSAGRLLPLLREAGLIRLIRQGRGRRSSIYAFTKLLEIAEA